MSSVYRVSLKAILGDPGAVSRVDYMFSPHVRESRTVLDSGFHAVDSGFRVLDSGFQKELDSIFFPVLMLFFTLRFMFESCYIERRC